MKLLPVLSMILASAEALNILLGNDDGWATANIRSLYKALKDSGHKVLLVAPVSNQSGKGGSLTLATKNNLTVAGEFGIVPKGSPSWGTDPKDGNIWYIDGTPSTATFFALDYVVPKVWGDVKPDLLLSGPNEGNNCGAFAFTGSGTIGAAYSAIGRGIPGIAVSANDLAHRDYRNVTNSTDISVLAAKATTRFIDFLASKVKSGRLLPMGYGINLNFPKLNESCSAPGYALSRLSTAEGLAKWKVNETTGVASFGSQVNDPSLDVCFHGNCDLPSELTVLKDCTSSVSIFTIDYNAPNSTITSDLRRLLQPLVVVTKTKGSNATQPSAPASVPTSGAVLEQPLRWLAPAAAVAAVGLSHFLSAQ